jgi:ketosteroid isomerase-like protein
MKYTILLSLLLGSSIMMQNSFAQIPDVNAIVDAERSFSKSSVEKGRKHAFLTYLAEDSILFNPEPVHGHKLTQERPESPGFLIWEPAFVEIAASGDFGYSTGPWVFKQKLEDEKPVAHGHFFSIWKKQSDGSWRVIADTGISNPPPEAPVVLKTVKPEQTSSQKMDPQELNSAIAKSDTAFSQLSASKGAVEAYKSYLAPQTRFYRNGMFPETDHSKINEYLSGVTGKFTWEPKGGSAALSGDLAYSYGLYELSGETSIEKGSYVRVWKKQSDGSWKVAAEVLNQPPPKKN